MEIEVHTSELKTLG